jgi:hypothetical protein
MEQGGLKTFLYQEDEMSDFFQHVTDQQDIFKKLASYIPGFNGYIERQNRRASDKLLRDTVSRRFGELYKRASAQQTEMIKQGQISYVDDMESAVVKIQTVMDKMKTATYGYTGFFDAVKINEKELAAIYTFDMTFFELADKINAALDNVEATMSDEAGLPAAIRNLVSLSRDAVEAFDRRYEVINSDQGQ